MLRPNGRDDKNGSNATIAIRAAWKNSTIISAAARKRTFTPCPKGTDKRHDQCSRSHGQRQSKIRKRL